MKLKVIIIGLFIAFAFTSCGSEFGLANRFVVQSPKTRVAVYFPEAAQVTLVQGDDGTYTKVLDSVDQNAFLDIMYGAYADGLRDYGMEVYVPDNPDNIQVDSAHWLVILSQVELQGLFTEYVDHLFDFIDEYDYSFTLNTVNVASWYDVNNGEWLPTLYDEYNLRDDFSSHVTQSRQNVVQYHYDITPLKTEDVYDFAVFLGKRHASFTYDYMMNRFVESELKAKNREPRFKLHWDPIEGSFYFQQEEEGFWEIKN